jgi:hypothetical protein
MMNLEEAYNYYIRNKQKEDKKLPGLGEPVRMAATNLRNDVVDAEKRWARSRRIFCKFCNRALAIDSNELICDMCQKTREQGIIAGAEKDPNAIRRGEYGRMSYTISPVKTQWNPKICRICATKAIDEFRTMDDICDECRADSVTRTVQPITSSGAVWQYPSDADLKVVRDTAVNNSIVAEINNLRAQVALLKALNKEAVSEDAPIVCNEILVTGRKFRKPE